jgi:Zn-dependent M28 family amino/carboxypeptidase
LKGLLGSKHYVENLDEDDLKKIYLNLNFDMLGKIYIKEGSSNFIRVILYFSFREFIMEVQQIIN